MVALITSTLFPSNKGIFGESRSVFSWEERIEQTHRTIQSLREKEIREVYLVDNSGVEYGERIKDTFPGVKALAFDAYQFNNKSINEALLILNSFKYLPDDTAILKISGRYALNENFIKPAAMACSFIGRGYDFHLKRGSVTTKCYLVKNKEQYEKFMVQVLVELFSYPLRVVGPRNLLRLVKQWLTPRFEETTISIEFASARVLKHGDFTAQLVPTIGVEGYLATENDKRLVKE